MIVEQPDIPAPRVGCCGAPRWGVEVTAAEHVEVGVRGWHWRAAATTAGCSGSRPWRRSAPSEERARPARRARGRRRLAPRLLGFVVRRCRTRDARVAVDLAPGLLLTLTPYLDGAPSAPDRSRDDAERGRWSRACWATCTGSRGRGSCRSGRPGSARARARRDDLDGCWRRRSGPGTVVGAREPAGGRRGRRCCGRRCAGSRCWPPPSPAPPTGGWSRTANRTPPTCSAPRTARGWSTGRRSRWPPASATCARCWARRGRRPLVRLPGGRRPSRAAVPGHRRAVRAAVAPVRHRRAGGAVLRAARGHRRRAAMLRRPRGAGRRPAGPLGLRSAAVT